MTHAFLVAGEIVAAVLALLVMFGVGFLVWKRSLLIVQAEAIKTYETALEAANARIEQLEAARIRDDAERQQLRAEIAELRGEVKGQRDLAQAIIETIAESRVCLNAPDCDNRVVPS